MRGAPGRSDRHESHTFDASQYCTGCGSFIGSLLPSIAEPCAMDRPVVPPDVNWLETLRWL